MLSLPASVLLIPYALFMLGYVFFSFANILSLTKYGARDAIGLLASFIFISGSLIIVFLTWQSLMTTDWFAAVPLFDVPTPTF